MKLSMKEVLSILENDIYKIKEIRKLLIPVIEENKREFLPAGQKFFNFKKVERMKKRTMKLNDTDKQEYKKELTEYIKKLQQLVEEI